MVQGRLCALTRVGPLHFLGLVGIGTLLKFSLVNKNYSSARSTPLLTLAISGPLR
jgi:hypothetical protein